MLDQKNKEIISLLGGSLFLKINKLLLSHSKKSGNSIKSIQDILEFVPDTECVGFLENIKSHVDGNVAVLKQIDDNCKKINTIYNNNEGSALVALFVYSIGDKMSDISNTIKGHNKKLFKEMIKHDRCSFLVTQSNYEKYIEDARCYGIPSGDGHTLQWVMPENNALNIIKMINEKTNPKDKKKIYAEKLGVPLDKLEEERSFYHILLDIKRLKLVRGIAKRVATFLPSKNVPGANEYWVPGGYTSGGTPEIIVNSCPRGKPFTIKEEKICF